MTTKPKPKWIGDEPFCFQVEDIGISFDGSIECPSCDYINHGGYCIPALRQQRDQAIAERDELKENRDNLITRIEDEGVIVRDLMSKYETKFDQLKVERHALQTAINNFCERTKNSHPSWHKQDYIKGLFDLWQPEEQGE